MLCVEARSMLDSYIAEILRDDVRAELEKHLAGCPECRAELEMARELLEDTSNTLRWAMPESALKERVAGQIMTATGLPQKTWGDVMREQWERAPWWMISAAVHAVILMLMTVITVATAQKRQDDIVITTDLAKKKEPEYDEKKIRDIFRNTKEVEAEEMVENPVFVHEEVEVTDHFETENDMDTNTARGQEDAISDIPLGGTGVVGNIGVGGGGAGCFGYRSGGGRRKAVARFGGSKASESAVDAALRWLARHQEADGYWDADKYEGQPQNDPGVTALAALAFLGAGHTERAGKFRDNVRRALAWIMATQAPNGMLGKKAEYQEHHGGWSYHHAICGLAMAEAYGMARNPKVGEVAQKAVDYSVNVHQVPYRAWRYTPKSSSNDASVSGWYVMQLKSAKIAGLKVEGKAFQGAITFLDQITTKPGQGGDQYGGRVGYTDHPGTAAKGGRWTNTTAIGGLCRLFTGSKRTDPMVIGAAEYLVEYLPNYNDTKSGVGNAGQWPFYYWYYGTLVMFQVGGKYWQAWNGAMRDMLIQHQRRGGDEDGSWDPHGAAEIKYAGRVYSTALGALCLEVYYRYLPITGK